MTSVPQPAASSLQPAASCLLILGASARAAACSACRAGYAPIALDLFADEDLRAVCPVTQIDDYPGGFVGAMQSHPRSRWLYTGGLENHPALVDRIARSHTLLGNSGRVLRRVRDPFVLADSLRSAGQRFPDVARDASGVSDSGRWLIKGYRSSGGHLVSDWNGESLSRVEQRRFYLQRFIAGTPCAAVYLARGGQAQLWGVTRQLVGEAWTGAGPLRYCGSIGPLMLNASHASDFARIGAALAATFGLVGLFGVDAILTDDGVWPVEVNPRYPASAEVLERVSGVSLVGLHVDACERPRGKTPGLGGDRFEHQVVAGKVIVFAERDLTITTDRQAFLMQQNAGLSDRWRPRVADIPRVGTMIRAGWPIATLLEDGVTAHDVERALYDRAGELRAHLT